MLGEMVDPVSDTLERRDRSDGRVKPFEIHCNSDPESTDISNMIGRPPGLERDMNPRPSKATPGSVVAPNVRGNPFYR